MASNNSSHDSAEVIAYQESQLPVILLYDTRILRPHLIVMQRECTSHATVNELQGTYKLIGHFLQKKPQFDDEAILSFRRGNWNRPRTGKWIARLYVAKDPHNIPRSNKRKGTGVEAEVNDWILEKKDHYNKGQTGCIAKEIPDKSFLDVSLSAFQTPEDAFELVWISSSPRVGILARSPTTSTLADLYQFMSRVYSDIEGALRIYRKDLKSTFDAHLCLYVRGQSEMNVTCRQDQILTENEEIVNKQNLVGYIQVNENEYVQWLPQNLKKIWLNKFGQTEFFVGT